jgi:hypothetical protein
VADELASFGLRELALATNNQSELPLSFRVIFFRKLHVEETRSGEITLSKFSAREQGEWCELPLTKITWSGL